MVPEPVNIILDVKYNTGATPTTPKLLYTAYPTIPVGPKTNTPFPPLLVGEVDHK